MRFLQGFSLLVVAAVSEHLHRRAAQVGECTAAGAAVGHPNDACGSIVTPSWCITPTFPAAQTAWFQMNSCSLS